MNNYVGTRMNLFLFKILFFSFMSTFSLVVLFLLEQGDVDPFYQKLRGYEKSSLIIGTSKAAQGILHQFWTID